MYSGVIIKFSLSYSCLSIVITISLFATRYVSKGSKNFEISRGSYLLSSNIFLKLTLTISIVLGLCLNFIKVFNNILFIAVPAKIPIFLVSCNLNPSP